MSGRVMLLRAGFSLFAVLMTSVAGTSSNAPSSQIARAPLSALFSPSLCNLKLICSVYKARNSIRQQQFIRGISRLAKERGNRTETALLNKAIQAGELGRSCKSIAPSCPHTEMELMTALKEMGLLEGSRSRVKRQIYRRHYSPYRRFPYSRNTLPYLPLRRQGLSFSSMPPIFRPDTAGRRNVCRACDQRSTVCTVYSIGTYAGCTGVWLVAGVPGQFACNVATAPGSIGCGMNTLHCYMSGCGLINLPRLP